MQVDDSEIGFSLPQPNPVAIFHYNKNVTEAIRNNDIG